MLADVIRDVWAAHKPVLANQAKDRLTKGAVVAGAAMIALHAAAARVGRWGTS